MKLRVVEGLALALLVALCAVIGTSRATRAEASAPETLTARYSARAPALDGVLEPLWDRAETSVVQLYAGRHSGLPVQQIELRALYTADALFFAASWPQANPPAPAAETQNKLILHFALAAPWPGADDVMCLVACHTAYIDGEQRASYVAAETIPPGATRPLAVGGGWRDGRWTFEWGRPLRNDNSYDVQFTDLGASYPVFVKVVEGLDDQPDPISEDLVLRFEACR